MAQRQHKGGSMEVREYEDLKKKLCKELEDIKSRKNIGMAEIEIIDKLTHSIKNLDKIIENEGEGGYSEAGYRRYSRDGGNSYRGGNWSAEGSYRGGNSYGDSYGNNSYDGDNYGNGNSYARRGQHYVRGHYSYGEDSDMLTQRIEEMMQDDRLGMEDKKTLRRAMDIMRK